MAPQLEKRDSNSDTCNEYVVGINGKCIDAKKDEGEINRPPNPLKEASFFSKLFFTWPYKLMKVGKGRPIKEIDLPEIVLEDSAEHNLNLMERIWTQEKERVERIRSSLPPGSKMREKIQPSLHRAILKEFFTSTWIVQPLMCATAASKIVQALALGFLLRSFESNNNSDGFIWASVMVICNAIILFEHHHVFFLTWRKGMQIRTAAVEAIFAKSLKLKSTADIESISSGQIMNMVSNDVERFILTALFVFYIIWAPLQALAILIVGWRVIGTAFVAGFALLFLVFVPLQFYLSKRFAVLRSKVAEITDARITLLSQAVTGVRVMKMSGWECQFNNRIAKIREKEVRQIQRANRLKAFNEAVYFSVNIVVSIVIFVVHVFRGGELTLSNVFVVVTLMNVTQIEMTKHLSLAVMAGSECWVSVKRIQSFLEFPELVNPEKQCQNFLSVCKKDKSAVTLDNVTCFWNADVPIINNKNEMKKFDDAHDVIENNYQSSLVKAVSDINLDLKFGEITCVVGSVGSGKSAILMALAGELPISKGKIERHYSSVAYASQDPWIMNGTIQENILMGLEMDSTFYNEVISACGLKTDFERFINGDMTIVGDRGVQCSGGQRARIGLARAIYQDPDVLLLDDPLSAVDTKVGRKMFYSAIIGLGVKKEKCVVLATHQHQYIGASKCVFMSNGYAKCVGSFEECVSAAEGKIFLAIHTEDRQTMKDENGFTHEPADDDEKAVDTVEVNENNGIIVANETIDEKSNDQDEVKNSGVVSRDTFVFYARAMGGLWLAVLLVILFAVTQTSVLASITAIGRWSKQSPDKQKSFSTLIIVLSLGMTVVILACIRATVCFHFTVRASQKLHNTMTTAVLRAKIEFFDTNPTGRILNRFSADVGSNDDILPHTLFDFMVTSFLVLGSLVTGLVVLPFTFIAMPPLIWYFVRVRRTFVKTSRELKRLEGLARSPIFAMLSESLSGIATLRTNNSVDYFKRKFEDAHDAHTRAFFAFLSSSRWVGFRMDALMFINLSVSSFLAVLFNTQGWFSVDPLSLGVALTMLLQLSSLFQWCIRQSAEVVNQMVSVERVAEFSNLPSEAPLNTDADVEARKWPHTGDIEVKRLAIRYRSSLPLSLSDVSFKIAGGHRVGVVGRTGSGKSTLVQALFRILEAERGLILVDGIDIHTLGLHKVRKEMSVINQHPVLFSGCTIRENLDPFDNHTTEEIREALDDVQMTDAIGDLPCGLNTLVTESGTNFSVGQRQLLCLARAILKKSKILVLDEPTANVDSRTDKLLQEAVNKSFRGATIISVAHRLDTVIENDYILVLGQGEILEYGSPEELIRRKDGHFASMVDDTGREMSQDLRQRSIGRSVERK